jgi:isoleucyl-tRNA synthetase
VHLSDWPAPSGARDDALSERVEGARRLVALGRAARSDARAKTRQPLRRALLLHPGVTLDDAAREEIKGELNVKALEDVDTLSGLMTWQVLPNFRALGPRLGPKVNEVKAALAGADGSALRRELDEHGAIEIAGERLTRDEVDVRATRHASFALAEEGGWAVAIDLELDDELRREGLARELVRSLNELRKDQGLAIADRVRVSLSGDATIRSAFDAHRSWIAEEVLALELTWGDGGDLSVDIDGQPVAVALARAG